MSVHVDAPVPSILGPAARDAAVRRNTFLLAGAQGLVSTTFSVLLIVGSVAAADLAGRDGIVGVVNAGYFLAAAGGAMVFGRSMDRYGRRAGLVVSYLAVALAGIGCGVAIAAGSLPALLVFTTLFGFSFGGTNLARGAVADMYPVERRGRAVGIVLAVGTVGAVGSPFLVAFLRSWSEREALDPLVVPWILVPIAAVGALACALALRPDPRALAVRDHAAAPHIRRAPSELLASPAIRTAVVTAAIGQMAMVAVMGVTPVALEHHHSSPTVISTVISVHVFGMWGLSPLIGVALDRIGRRPVLLAGGVISVAGAVLAGTDAGPAVVGTGLFAIGLGWSATFLGATAVVSDATQPSERAGALGFTDLVISLSSGAAGLVGGFVFEGAGMRVLGFGVATVVLLVVVAVARMRETVAPAGG
ncbi:MAG TPA: MFS transporter [Actinomycetota bacterium]|nr:MFS transporter [Actinomycetota bacterium]